jgi:DMSO/TMAO reductase YedYZ molybdopterin-dependent catalytic subunit
MAGSLGAAAALAVSELVTGMRDSGPSLVSAVGTEFIDRFAASLKSLAVSLFGTNDKVALVVGIVIVSLLLGGLFGMVARTRFWLGAAGFGAFGAVGLWAYLRHPAGDTVTGLLAAGLAVAAGIGTLALLLRLSRSEGVSSQAAAVMGMPSRRAFLTASATLGVGAAVTAALGRRARGANASAAREAVVLPTAARAVASPRPELAIPGLSPYITPNEDFYRIDTALTVPQVDLDSWRLDVRGMVERPFSVSFDDLLAMDGVEETVTLQCVSNEVGGDLVGNAAWQGVPLVDLLERAGVEAGASQVVGRSVDRWTAGFPTELAGDGRVAIVAYAMNGEPLPLRHGFPARLVVSGLYGYVSATKWLREIELTTWDGFDGYWVPRGWAKEGPIKTASRIDVPRSGATVEAGGVAVAGVAWAPTRGISAVEVQVDDGAWETCRLADVASEHTWVQWVLDWDATPGDHVLRVRATDATGTVQTSDMRPPQPDGATGWHARRVRVETAS